MAIMIPEKPYYMDEKSREDLIFEALKNNLDDNYYVFHSLKNYGVKNGIIHENEADFVIYNRNKGIMVIEAKASFSKCDENGNWYYKNGVKMAHGGPFKQANRNMWILQDYIENETNASYLASRCHFCCAVWLVGTKKSELNNITFPMDFDKQFVLTLDDLTNPKESIDRIFSYKRKDEEDTKLKDNEHSDMIFKVLCPTFEIAPTSTKVNDLNNIVFHRLLKEQELVLRFLVEQRTVAINGAAGTGKTMVAVQRAMQCANRGERVLFLCYNKFLKEFLENTYEHKLIKYYTLDGFATSMVGSNDYVKLNEKLYDCYIKSDFEYNHIVIDEGQDFGKDNLNEVEILDTLCEIIKARDNSDSFYVFYDRLQLVQGNRLPNWIVNADSKLTLYTNCRNTKNIATTAMCRLDGMVKVHEKAVIGDKAILHFCENEVKTCIDTIIQKYLSEGIKRKDIVIITCKTENNSALSNYAKDGLYNNCMFTTIRKFKGLEADVVILIDVDKASFGDVDIKSPFSDNKLCFYVGASRARHNLEIVTDMDDDDCKSVLENDFKFKKKIKSPKVFLANELKAII